MPRAPVRQRGTFEIDHQVATLGAAEEMPIGEQPPIQHHAGTDAGAERENEEVVDAPSGAGAPLGIAGEPAVIVGAYWNVPPSPQIRHRPVTIEPADFSRQIDASDL